MRDLVYISKVVRDGMPMVPNTIDKYGKRYKFAALYRKHDEAEKACYSNNLFFDNVTHRRKFIFVIIKDSKSSVNPVYGLYVRNW